MAISSEEVNYLVYRYLLESGFQHSAFTFGIESHSHECSVEAGLVPPGALIAVLQKGVQYVEAEASIAEDGSIIEEDKLTPLSLVGAVVQSTLMAQKRGRTDSSIKGGGAGGRAKKEEDQEQSGEEPTVDDAMETSQQAVADSSTTVSQELVAEFHGHQSEVLTCQWSPTEDLLASGSADSTARVWALEPPGVLPHVLQHETDSNKAKDGCDVTTLHWKSDGSVLATGCYDGQARVWSKSGCLKATLSQHKGPVFTIKWSPNGSYLATGGVDNVVLLWDALTNEVKQELVMHKAPVLDLDWQDSSTLATCSTDHLVLVWKVDSDKPIKTFAGHTNGVNCVQWDSSGTLLASCSDDRTAKIWSLKQDSPLHNLADHIGDVYTLRWSPTGEGSGNPNTPLVLATASFDSTVRLWDPESGKCLHTLEHHTQPVYSVAFSPDGHYLATGSRDKLCVVWDVKSGHLVRQYEGGGGIFEVAWNSSGTKLAASFQDSSISLLDLRKLTI